MMKTTIATMGLAALVLASCENPADKSADATVKEAVQPEATATTGTRYAFADGSSIGFTGSKVTGSHDGGFKVFTGHFLVNGEEVTGGEVVIDMQSTWADDEKLAGHLKSPDFFNVDEHPQATFVITGVEASGDNAYTVSGNFKLHGVEKNITFPATATKDGDSVTIAAEFDINRKDFQIDYPGMADDLIRDEVVIRLDLAAKPDATSES